MNTRAERHRLSALHTASVALAAGLALAAFAPVAQAQTPAGCELLKDPNMRAKFSGSLETKLMILCGEINESALAAVEAQAIVAGPEAEHVRGNDVRVNDLNNGTQSETSIARGRGGTLCVAWNDSGRNVAVNGFSAFGSSRNNGQTWQDNGPFPPGPGPDRNFGDPSLAWSDRDQVFYYGALSDLGLSLWTSTDGCQTFQYVGPIHVGGGDDKELIAVDNNKDSPYYGRIYVGWSNFALPTEM